MKKILKLFVLVAILTSCTDLDEVFYDKIPGSEYPENALQIALETAPMYRPLQDFIDGGGWWFCQEVTSDEMTCPTRATDWDDGGKWRALHDHSWDNTTEAVEAMWGRFYEGIGKINQLLEKYSEAPSTPDILAIQGQLRIMRAYYYYLLIDNYGSVPYVTKFAEAEDNPMAEDRATIYATIAQEIEDNVGFLKSSSSKTSVTKGMAWSVLAKLYLNAEVYSGTPQWANAERICDSIIALGTYSLESNPLGPFITENSASSENIFAIPYDRDNYEGFNLHMRTLHYGHNLTFDMTVGPWNGFAATEAQYNLYDATDMRLDYFLVGPQFQSNGAPLMDAVAGAQVDLNPHIPALKMELASHTFEEVRFSGARVVKFEIENGASDNLSNDFPLFRYADILLMKAEAAVRQGGNGDDFLNDVRNRSGLSDISGATLQDILDERARELFWEGHRRQDQIRFGTFNDAWWEKGANGTDRNVFPIPQWVLDTNPNLS